MVEYRPIIVSGTNLVEPPDGNVLPVTLGGTGSSSIADFSDLISDVSALSGLSDTDIPTVPNGGEFLVFITPDGTWQASNTGNTLTLLDNLFVSGHTTLSGLTVNGESNFQNSLSANDAVDALDTLTVHAQFIGKAPSNFEDDLEIDGNLGVSSYSEFSNSATIGSGLIVDTNTLVALGHNGRVGIGTAAPSIDLHVDDNNAPHGNLPSISDNTQALFSRNGLASISIVADPGAHSRINFGDDDDENRGYITYNHDTDTFSITTAATTNRLVIDENGKISLADDLGVSGNLDIAGSSLVVQKNPLRVGVGTGAPSQRLHVSAGPGERLYVEGAGNSLPTLADDIYFEVGRS